MLKLRSEVFVVEQDCVYQDIDGKDEKSHHLLGYEGELVAYTRIVPPGLSFPELSIGRVVTSPRRRKEGMGKLLMIKSIESAYALYGKCAIRIGAQLYLKKFYESLDFVQMSEVYDEDGIAHIEMLLR